MTIQEIQQEVYNLDDAGQISDGYHSFDELYEHRITLWIALCKTAYLSDYTCEDETGNMTAFTVWRTLLHSDGSKFDGWFVLGYGYIEGEQITYHLPLSKWDECNFAKTLDKAPKFDGHTSKDVLERIKKYF